MSENDLSAETGLVAKEPPRPRGLGRGLSALIGDAPPTPEAALAGEKPREAAIERLRRNPNQPRKRFDPADLEALAESIRAHGVIQPILVRAVAGEADRWEIVAGERRWRAAQSIGLSHVPIVVRELDDLATLEISIVENLQRTDLDPIEEAMAFQQLLERFGRTQQAVAEAVGRSRAHVANTLRLLTLPEGVKDLVRTGQLSAGHARAALAAPDPEAAAEEMVRRGLSVRDAERLVQRGRTGQAGGMTGSASRETLIDPEARALAADLSAALGLEVSLTHQRGKGGTLAIAYRTLEQLDDLCRRLMASTH
jgi:ParB family transcriptional regulator, chromosome partitioning protein